MAKSERFVLVKKDSGNLDMNTSAKVIVDKETGVNYLYVGSGYGGGLAPLLDRDGNPIVTGTYVLCEEDMHG